MRTLKTALAVLICLALDFVTGHGTPLNACIAAVLTMQATQRESYNVGAKRLLGTAIGGVIGLAMLGVYTLLPYDTLRLALAALGVMLAISICCHIHNQEAAAITAIVVLGVTLERNASNPFVFALWLMAETAVGVLVAVLVNRFVARPKDAARKASAARDGDSPGNTGNSPDTISDAESAITNLEPSQEASSHQKEEK